MSLDTHGKKGHGDFERQDIGSAGIIYFFVGLAAATVLIHFLLVGLYDFLDKREKAQQAPMNPLVTDTSADTRKIPEKYPDKVFPDPRLETDERNQLDQIRLTEEQKLSTYDWVDQKAGTVRIPIDRAMDLVAQRGLPVRQEASGQAPAEKKGRKP
jgi:hypothetical protein